jgi:hypothetical protein
MEHNSNFSYMTGRDVKKEKRNKRKQFSYNGLILGLINHSHSDVDDENNFRDYISLEKVVN